MNGFKCVNSSWYYRLGPTLLSGGLDLVSHRENWWESGTNWSLCPPPTVEHTTYCRHFSSQVPYRTLNIGFTISMLSSGLDPCISVTTTIYRLCSQGPLRSLSWKRVKTLKRRMTPLLHTLLVKVHVVRSHLVFHECPLCTYKAPFSLSFLFAN